jgi:hypothetical protein
VTGTILEVLPFQSISREKMMGPFTVATFCRAVGSEKVVGDAVILVTQVAHGPEGRRELSVPEAAR